MALANMKNNTTEPHANTEPETIRGFDDEPSPRRKLPRSVKILAGTAIGLVLIAGAGGVIATQMIDQNEIKKMAVEKIAAATGYTVDWQGNIGISLLPMPHVSVGGVSVSNKDIEILTAKNISADVALWPLLSKRIEVTQVVVAEPVINLVTDKQGNKTWAVTKAAAEENSPASADNSTAADAPMAVAVNRVDIQGGKLVWDNQEAESKQALESVDLRLDAETLSGPFDLKSDFEWNGATYNISGTTGQLEGQNKQIPVQLNLSTGGNDMRMTFSGNVENGASIKLNGDLEIIAENLGDAIKSISGKPTDLPKELAGKFSLAGKLVTSETRVGVDDMMMVLGPVNYSGQIAVAGFNGEAPPKLSFSLIPTQSSREGDSPLVAFLRDTSLAGQGSVDGNTISIGKANFKAGGNDIFLGGRIVTGGAVPNLDVTITSNNLDIDGLKKKLGMADAAPTAAKDDAKQKDAAANTEVSISGFSLPFTGHINAKFGKIMSGEKSYSNVVADVTAKGNALTIENFAAGVGNEASISVRGKIADTQKIEGLDLKVGARTVDAEKLAKDMGLALPATSQKIGAASLDGSFKGSLEELDFDATVEAQKFELSGRGIVTTPLTSPQIDKLNFKMRHPNFAEAMRYIQPDFQSSPALAKAFNLSGVLTWNDKKYDLTGLDGIFGTTTVGGRVSVDMAGKPNVVGDLKLGDIVFDKSAAAASSSGGSSVSGAAASGRWSREPINVDWMKSFNADVKITASSIRQNLWLFSNANLDFGLEGGTLTIRDMSAKMFGGSASMNGTVKAGATAKDQLTIRAEMKARDVDAKGVMSAVTGATTDKITGTLSNLEVTASASGVSQYDLVRSLDGNGNIDGRNLVVKGVDAAQLAAAAQGSYKPLERLGTLAGAVSQKNQTAFDSFIFQYTINDGLLTIGKSLFDGPSSSLTTTGTVDFPAWRVNLANTMVVKNVDMEPVKFTVSGSLDNPAQSGLQSYLMQRVDKLLLKKDSKISKTLGKFLGQPESQAPAGDGSGEAAPVTDGTDAPAPQVKPVSNKDKAAQEAVKALQGLFGGR